MFITLMWPLIKARLIPITFYTARTLTVCLFIFIFPVKYSKNTCIEALKTCKKITSIVLQGNYGMHLTLQCWFARAAKGSNQTGRGRATGIVSSSTGLCSCFTTGTYYMLQHLTCSQGRGTSVYLGQWPGNVSAGTPRSAPAGPGHPGSHGRPAGPVFRGTAGTQCPPGSLISQCAGTVGGSQSTFGGNRR